SVGQPRAVRFVPCGERIIIGSLRLAACSHSARAADAAPGVARPVWDLRPLPVVVGRVEDGGMTTVRDATPERWPELETLFGERGDPSRCWCQYYRSPDPYHHGARAENREAMRRQVAESTVPHGVLCYEQDRPVGWCAVAPRADYPRLLSMRAAA